MIPDCLLFVFDLGQLEHVFGRTGCLVGGVIGVYSVLEERVRAHSKVIGTTLLLVGSRGW